MHSLGVVFKKNKIKISRLRPESTILSTQSDPIRIASKEPGECNCLSREQPERSTY